jgi:ribosomal protein S18 acetylase RimI-like enzyme
MNQTPDCRLLTLADADTAARIISHAFVDDPLCAFMLPFRRTRIKTLHKFFRPYSEISIQNNFAYGSGDPLQGVAFWHSPNQKDLSINLKTLGRFLPLLFTMYPIGYLRARAILAQTDALHKKYAGKPHYYLDNIGVLASARGRGIASNLIRPFLAQADAQNTIAYTDTVTPANVPLYQHFGFHLIEQATIPHTPITIYALHRPTP